MDEALSTRIIKRDWTAFTEQAARLRLGQPALEGTRIDLSVTPAGTSDRFRAVLFCDGYDAQAPLLDFADLNDPALLGGPYWPKMANAPINSVEVGGRTVPIICTPGSRGYHLHSSHSGEVFERKTWLLPAVATLLHRFVHEMGPYGGRGL